MRNNQNIISRIKSAVLLQQPDATVILFGSYARGTHTKSSDIDVLILLNAEKITTDIEKNITDPLYDLEFETSVLISPVVLSKKDWDGRHRATPFHTNVLKEGMLL